MNKKPEHKKKETNLLDDEEEHPGNLHEEKENEDNENQNNKKEISEKQEYLEKKMKDNYNSKVTNKAAKAIEDIMDGIKNDYRHNKLKINVSPRNIDKVIFKDGKEIHLNNDDRNLISKRNLKQLKELRSEKTNLENKIQKLKVQKNILQEEKNSHLSQVNENIRISELRKVKSDLNDCNSKLYYVEISIKNILAEENYIPKEERIKELMDNYKKTQEKEELKLNEKMKKYYERTKEMEKKTKELEEIEENEKKKILEAEQKRSEIIKDKVKERQNKEKEKREMIKKFAEEKEKENLDKLKQFIEEKKIEDRSGLKEKDYLYNKYEENYKKEKEKKILKNLLDIKKKFEPIKLNEEIKKFNEKIEIKLQEMKKKKEEKEQLEEKLKNQNYKLPKYKTSLFKKYDEELQKLKEIEKEKNLKRKQTYEKGISYSKKVIEEMKKKKEEEELEEPKPKKIKEPKKIKDNKKNRVILKKRDPNKPSKFHWDLKLDEIDINNPLGTSVDIQKAINKKPKRLFYSIEAKPIIKPNKKIDYLDEFIKDRAETEEAIDGEEIGKKWNRIINNKKIPIQENLKNVKNKADLLEKKAIENENVLRINGGLESNPSLGKKVSGMLIDAIHAKLSIIDSMEKK